jgi:hypothetical protein
MQLKSFQHFNKRKKVPKKENLLPPLPAPKSVNHFQDATICFEFGTSSFGFDCGSAALRPLR